MIKRVTALAALAVLAACAASNESVVAERAPPPPAYTDNAPVSAPSAPAAAPNVVLAQAPTPTPPVRTNDNDDDIVVPGQVERQVPPPSGDPRTATERMADIRNWDQCVMQAQNRAEGDPLRPSFDSPEGSCSTQLGMSDRNAVPNSRLRRP